MSLSIFAIYSLLIYLGVSLYLKKFRKKKKELYLTLDRIKDAVVSVDNEWRYTFLNDAALKTHQFGREATLGKVLWNVHPELVDTIFWDAFHKAKVSGTIAEIESHFATTDRWFSVKAYPSETGLTIFYRDITERKKIRVELTKSEEKYRALFYNSPLPTWLYDIESLNFIDVNQAAVKHYGYSRGEFLSMTIKDIRPKEDIGDLLGMIDEVRNDSGTPRFSSWRHRNKNGDILNVEITAHSFNNDGKEVRAIIVNDVTQKKIMEQKLLENQMKLNEAQAIGHLGNWDIDLQKEEHTWSDELYKIFGLDKMRTEPSVGLFLSFIHPEDRRVAKKLINRALSASKEAKTDFRFLTQAGQIRFGYIEWRVRYNEDKIPVRLFGIIQDITARKQAEESSRSLENQIKEQKIQEQKKISKAIIKAQEKQKNHIAQELHDNINQILFGVKFQLGAAGRRDELLNELVKSPVEQITKAMDEIHLLCQSLVTPLAEFNLEEIIRELIYKLNCTIDPHLNILFSYSVPFEISYDLKLNIYRIIQEQLRNICKHAAAKNVHIDLSVKDNSIYIMVTDDGKGFDMQKKRKGLGISNIMHRTEAFNGQVDIWSKVGEGCKVAVMIPYDTYVDKTA